ncbi:NUDIX hydrolase [Saccharopolyspora phatthalungensis]|uniref:8-oxo-dGTP pyrophosphatase MutT (NUDIX family) n=1 Tax=Saccharopolyspora phatthalungensis TaxID=664693 RepID=A0A840Q0Y1_9PSEU|nr:NUDIX domain-containing protein [Saccharopolyspora phatthalungensis]MBB5154014.1 8-oxo-dGTP pyrophosphatase MutT (NUDIX family) [Saccharopolyspora phatthalungensis]
MVLLPEDRSLPTGFVPETPPQQPAEAKDAATVVLLRNGTTGLEVFLQRRVKGMPFAGGMTVFPGGGVDQRDADTSVAWSGPDAQWWAARFDCSPELARALVCAAVRETFEESGVLLAGPDTATVVGETSRYAEARAAMVARNLSLAEFLADERLVLRADLLRPWANWLTPEREPRRYDTRFFLAAMPEGQRADAVTTEAAEAYWATPEQALADFAEGRCHLLPPTRITLDELVECGSMAAALAAERTLGKISPKLVRRNGRWHVVMPGEPGFEEAN